jgi:hypothetical protein
MKNRLFLSCVITVLVLVSCENNSPTNANTYTIVFDVGNDAEPMLDQTVTDGFVLDLSQYKPISETGGDLLAWYDGNIKLGTLITINKNITIKAVYRWSQWVKTTKPEWFTWEDIWPLNDNSINRHYSDDIMKITVKDNVVGEGNRWMVSASYEYPGEAGKKYEYKFEAWTQSGTRSVDMEYYDNAVTDEYLKIPFDITTEHKVYTLTGTKELDENSGSALDFQCADVTGSFFIKIISITPID